MPSSFDVALVILCVVLPDFISQRVVAGALPRNEQNSHGLVLEAMLFSTVNFAVFGWLLLFVDILTVWLNHHRAWGLVAWLLGMVVLPVIWGLAFVLAIKRSWIGWLYSRLGMSFIDPVARPWDFIFAQPKSWLLRVTLTDGRMIAGRSPGPESRAGAHPAPRTSIWNVSMQSTRMRTSMHAL